MNPPATAALMAPRSQLADLDSQSVTLAEPLTALQAWQKIMAQRLPGLGLAFRIRDVISARFGLARIGGF